MDVDDKKSFTWYDSNDDKIDGQTTDTYEVKNVTKNTSYYCRVEDGYGTYEDVYFNIYIQNNFKAYPKGMSSFATSKDVTINPGDTLTLEVETEADIAEGMTFAWYDSDGDVISNAVSNKLVVTDKHPDSKYSCIVSDCFGNSKTVTFYVFVETNLEAKSDGDKNITVESEMM